MGKFGLSNNIFLKGINISENDIKQLNDENQKMMKNIEIKNREEFISSLQKLKIPYTDIEKYCKEKFGY